MIKFIPTFNYVIKDIIKVLSIIGLIMTIIIKVRTLLGYTNGSSNSKPLFSNQTNRSNNEDCKPMKCSSTN